MRDNAWQLALWCDLRRSFRAGLPPGTGQLTCLGHHDRWVAPLLAWHPGAGMSALLVRLWFAWLLARERQRGQKAASH